MTDTRLDRLEEIAYQTLFRSDHAMYGAAKNFVARFRGGGLILFSESRDSDEALISHLMNQGESRTMALMAIHSAYERRIEEALSGKLSYLAWLSTVCRNIRNGGWAILALAVGASFVAGQALASLYPRLPELSRAPGWILSRTLEPAILLLIGGGIFLLGSRILFERVRRKTRAQEAEDPATGRDESGEESPDPPLKTEKTPDAEVDRPDQRQDDDPNSRDAIDEADPEGQRKAKKSTDQEPGGKELPAVEAPPSEEAGLDPMKIEADEDESPA
ncbi:MAG: hypothetical protein AAF725_18055 [Acidobacteriota bacterium]